MSSPFDIDAAAGWIESLQAPDGAIRWIEAGLWDPWNHVESAIGLISAGRLDAAERAFTYLAAAQEPDGGWTADLGAAAPMDAANRRLVPEAPRVRETNFAAWTAVGVLALGLASGPAAFRRHGPMALAACDFAIRHQTPHGDIVWAAPPGGDLESVDSLYAANCAIYLALGAAEAIAAALGLSPARYAATRARLREALTGRPDRFDRTWPSKRGHAMDWYYPVLAGVVTGPAARAHLAARWDEFVEPRHGCRCVSDQPWATAAETAELALACIAAGDAPRASDMLRLAARMQDSSGGLWMGRQFALDIHWPEERPSWTAGAALIAADALHGLSPAGAIFRAPQAIRSISISEPTLSAGSNRPEAAARR